MTETVYVAPTNGRLQQRKGPFIPPLLIVPFVLYNVVAFLFMGGQPAGWQNGLFNIAMVSGTPWAVTAGDFLLVGAASSSVFFLLMVMSLIDVVAGFSVSITSAGRDVTMQS